MNPHASPAIAAAPQHGRTAPLTAPGQADVLLRARGLACERDGRRLFAPVDIDVRPGDVLELLGDNGAGKSTLLRTLAGMSPDYRGELSFAGTPLRASPPTMAGDMLFLGHRSGLNAQLGPDENLAWYARLASGDGASSERIDAALRAVGLIGYLGVPCGQLSAGQQRRAALARLLIGRARLWLLDEPTTALDTAGVALLEGLLAAHRARGGAAVIATHARLGAATATLRLEAVDDRDLADPDADADADADRDEDQDADDMDGVAWRAGDGNP